jgi:hypothetical protein
MRLQLARGNQRLLDPDTYDQIFTMHSITMILWYAAPILSGFAYSPRYGMDFCANLPWCCPRRSAQSHFVVTILHLRAPGMTGRRMPLFLYSTLTISITILFSLPSLTIACVFLELHRPWGTHFFDLSHGGFPLLWQQLFWFFGHPVGVCRLPAGNRDDFNAPAGDCFYVPVDLNDRRVLAHGLPPSEGNPPFHPQMVYVIPARSP